ncbi:MAG: type II toxin-antitoxin system RelE/ParE family toxin [Pseudomonadota bacterium]
MIRSLKGKIAKAIAAGEKPKRFPPHLIRSAENKLAMIEAAAVLSDLKSPPGNRLHALKGDRKGQYAISINDQWRVCFEWKKGAAEEVEIADYHD